MTPTQHEAVRLSQAYLTAPAAWIIEGPAARRFAPTLVGRLQALRVQTRAYITTSGLVLIGAARDPIVTVEKLKSVRASAYHADRVVEALDDVSGVLTFGAPPGPSDHVAFTLAPPPADDWRPITMPPPKHVSLRKRPQKVAPAPEQPAGVFPGLPPAWRGTGGART